MKFKNMIKIILATVIYHALLQAENTNEPTWSCKINASQQKIKDNNNNPFDEVFEEGMLPDSGDPSVFENQPEMNRQVKQIIGSTDSSDDESNIIATQTEAQNKKSGNLLEQFLEWLKKEAKRNTVTYDLEFLGLDNTSGSLFTSLKLVDYKAKIKPSFISGNYIKADIWKSNLSLSSSSLNDKLPGGTTFSIKPFDFEIYYERQIKESEWSKALNPFNMMYPSAFPNRSSKFKKMKVGDFAAVSFGAEFVLNFSENHISSHPNILRFFNISYPKFSSFRVFVYKIDDSHVRIKTMLVRGSKRVASLGANFIDDETHFNNHYLNNDIERNLNRAYQKILRFISFGLYDVEDQDLVLSDYILDITNPDVNCMYDQFMDSAMNTKTKLWLTSIKNLMKRVGDKDEYELEDYKKELEVYTKPLKDYYDYYKTTIKHQYAEKELDTDEYDPNYGLACVPKQYVEDPNNLNIKRIFDGAATSYIQRHFNFELNLLWFLNYRLRKQSVDTKFYINDDFLSSSSNLYSQNSCIDPRLSDKSRYFRFIGYQYSKDFMRRISETNGSDFHSEATSVIEKTDKGVYTNLVYTSLSEYILEDEFKVDEQSSFLNHVHKVLPPEIFQKFLDTFPEWKKSHNNFSEKKEFRMQYGLYLFPQALSFLKKTGITTQMIATKIDEIMEQHDIKLDFLPEDYHPANDDAPQYANSLEFKKSEFVASISETISNLIIDDNPDDKNLRFINDYNFKNLVKYMRKEKIPKLVSMFLIFMTDDLITQKNIEISNTNLTTGQNNPLIDKEKYFYFRLDSQETSTDPNNPGTIVKRVDFSTLTDSQKDVYEYTNNLRSSLNYSSHDMRYRYERK